MDYFAEVMAILDRWSHLGRRDVPNGTKLIGHIPHVGSIAYLHVVYAPLLPVQIDQIEMDIERKLPAVMRDFYARANGCSLFGGALTIDGLRFDYDRSLADTARQPVSIRTANMKVRPKCADISSIFFGWYKYDGSCLLFGRDEAVLMCPPSVAQPILYRWNSFPEMLVSEVKRLAAMFDDAGRKIDKDAPTIPPLAITRGTA